MKFKIFLINLLWVISRLIAPKQSLRILLTLPFLIILLITVSLLGHLSFINGKQTVDNLSYQLLFNITDRAKEKIKNYTDSTIFLNKLNADLAKTYLQYGENELLEILYKQIKHFPYVSYIYWGNKLGEFYGVRRFANNTLRVVVVNEKTANKVSYFKNINAYKQNIVESSYNEIYDSRVRPWYIEAVEKKVQYWSDIYSGFRDDIRCLTNYFPFYSSQNQLEGVLAIDIYPDKFRDFLQKLKVGKNGKIFIINDLGITVATSIKNENFKQHNNISDEQFKVINSADKLNQVAGRFILTKYNDLRKIAEPKQLKLSFNQQTYFLQLAPFKDDYGLDWLIVVVVPESDFMEQINANTRTNIGLCIAALAIAIIVGILTSRWITQPILRLNTAAKALAEGKWQQKVKIKRSDELGELAKSFNSMAFQLQDSFLALEIKNLDLQQAKEELAQSNLELEQKVRDRTLKLEETVKLLKGTQAQLIFENQLLRTTESSLNYEYTVGACLNPDAPTYVVREADRDLYREVRRGNFCYVLNARQMGKTSLCGRIFHLLEKEGVACGSLELTEINTHDLSEEKWYCDLISTLITRLNLTDQVNFRAWWRERVDNSPIHRMSEFIETVLLRAIPQQKIVIFIDEIDNILTLEKFNTDRFFWLVRSFYNRRSTNPEFNRLTFVFAGAAAPSDLIQNPNSTPFNIGKAIELKPFTSPEVLPLVEGLRDKHPNPQLLLDEVLLWTGGQPFLTQKVCKAIRDCCLNIKEGQEKEWIANLVHETIIDDWQVKDTPEHLTNIQNRLLNPQSSTVKLLKLYRQILISRTISDRQSLVEKELILTGLVRQQEGHLEVYNRIYQAVFHLGWLKKQLAISEPN